MKDWEINNAIQDWLGIDAAPPDYYHDRNALVGILPRLKPAQQCEFAEYLAYAVGMDDDYYEGWNAGPTKFFDLVTTPVPVMCKALLETLKLWRYENDPQEA